MYKSSRRVFGVASALTIGAVMLAPAASAALLGSNSGSGAVSVPALSGVTNSLPLSGNLLAPVQSLLGGSGVGELSGVTSLVGLAGGGLLAPVQGVLGGAGGGPLSGVTGLLGGSSGGPLSGVTGLLGGDGGGGVLAPVQGILGGSGGLLGGLTGAGSADSAGGALLDGVFQSVGGTTLACDAALPQVLSTFVGPAAGSVCALNPFDGGVVGLLGAL